MDLILYAQPKRWKVFQVLPMKGENDEHIEEFIISQQQFDHFIANHQFLKDHEILVSEDNSEMKDSYVMIDPAGRFLPIKKAFRNTAGQYWKQGLKKAYDEMDYSYRNF
jgi:radical S-adenosyl methionine domain-containing protein 2